MDTECSACPLLLVLNVAVEQIQSTYLVCRLKIWPVL